MSTSWRWETLHMGKHWTLMAATLWLTTFNIQHGLQHQPKLWAFVGCVTRPCFCQQSLQNRRHNDSSLIWHQRRRYFVLPWLNAGGSSRKFESTSKFWFFFCECIEALHCCVYRSAELTGFNLKPRFFYDVVTQSVRFSNKIGTTVRKHFAKYIIQWKKYKYVDTSYQQM